MSDPDMEPAAELSARDATGKAATVSCVAGSVRSGLFDTDTGLEQR